MFILTTGCVTHFTYTTAYLSQVCHEPCPIAQGKTIFCCSYIPLSLVEAEKDLGLQNLLALEKGAFE